MGKLRTSIPRQAYSELSGILFRHQKENNRPLRKMVFLWHIPVSIILFKITTKKD